MIGSGFGRGGGSELSVLQGTENFSPNSGIVLLLNIPMFHVSPISIRIRTHPGAYVILIYTENFI